VTVVKFNRSIRKSGGSAAIAVPTELMKALNWKIGENVELFADEEKLVIKKM
jgi:antitoxin component of MazEF toxin-antitoxin module